MCTILIRFCFALVCFTNRGYAGEDEHVQMLKDRS